MESVRWSALTAINEFIDILRKHGYKATPQRIAILKVLMERHDHPRADDIYEQVKHEFPTISRATVYNTLQIFIEAGMLQELAFYDDKTRFDANMQPHINLICSQCGRIDDIVDDDLSTLVTRIIQHTRFHLQSQRIDFYGLCQKCQTTRE